MNESNIQINLPKRVEKGMVLTADYLNAQREAIARLANRGNPTNSEAWAMVYPPLTVALKIISGSPVTYAVSVSPGYFLERNKCLGVDVDAMILWPLDGYLIGLDGFPAEFAIALDEAIFVHATENEYGAISAVEVLVLSNTTKSLNFISGLQSGDHYYKLAALETVDGETALVNYLAGSHIVHVSGLTCDVRVLSCDDPNTTEIDPAQLLRMSFVGGTMVAVGDSVAARPLAATVEECNVVQCT